MLSVAGGGVGAGLSVGAVTCVRHAAPCDCDARRRLSI